MPFRLLSRHRNAQADTLEQPQPRFLLVSGGPCTQCTEVLVRASGPVRHSCIGSFERFKRWDTFRRPHICLVLMDSRLDFLSMPVLKQPPDEPNGADLGGSLGESSYPVAFLMFHYFEWVGTFETSTFGNRSVISTHSLT